MICERGTPALREAAAAEWRHRWSFELQAAANVFEMEIRVFEPVQPKPRHAAGERILRCKTMGASCQTIAHPFS